MFLAIALRAVLLVAALHGTAKRAAAQADWITGPRGVPSSTGFECFDVFNPAMQDEPLAWTADRPARTLRPTTLAKGTRQLEAGYQFRYRDQAEVIRRSHSAPSLLYRYAPLGALELRLGWSYTWQEVNTRLGDVANVGSEDVSFGTKLLLTSQDAARPESAILLETRVPVGGSNAAADDVGFALDYLAGWSFEGLGAVFASTGLESLDESGDSFTRAHQSLAVAFQLGQQWELVFEYVGRYTSGRREELNQQSIDLAAAWRTNDRLQFDFLVGMGLNDDADDFFASAGGVLRF